MAEEDDDSVEYEPHDLLCHRPPRYWEAVLEVVKHEWPFPGSLPRGLCYFDDLPEKHPK